MPEGPAGEEEEHPARADRTSRIPSVASWLIMRRHGHNKRCSRKRPAPLPFRAAGQNSRRRMPGRPVSAAERQQAGSKRGRLPALAFSCPQTRWRFRGCPVVRHDLKKSWNNIPILTLCPCTIRSGRIGLLITWRRSAAHFGPTGRRSYRLWILIQHKRRQNNHGN